MNNETGSWLEGKHMYEMAIYSRPGKMYCILKESRVQTTHSYSLAAQENKYDNNYI